jgi:hypothetical protein
MSIWIGQDKVPYRAARDARMNYAPSDECASIAGSACRAWSNTVM